MTIRKIALPLIVLMIPVSHAMAQTNSQGGNPTTITVPWIFTQTIQTSFAYSAAGTPLPSCNTAAKGVHAMVSDATSPTYLGTYTSGGSVIAPVFCNGTNWLTD